MAKNTVSTATENDDFTEQDRVVALYQFIKELNKLKQKSILNMRDYPWALTFSDIPDDKENIALTYRDRVEDEAEDVSSVLLSVHKPEFQRCPQPDNCLLPWLDNGRDNYRDTVLVKDLIETKTENEEGQHLKRIGEDSETHESDTVTVVERFEDDEYRVKLYEIWLSDRISWAARVEANSKTNWQRYRQKCSSTKSKSS